MRRLIGILLAGFLAFAPHAEAGPTADRIKTRGVLVCGVSLMGPGFTMLDGRGGWYGFDVDFCRAIATALLGDDDKVRYVPVSLAERFSLLRDGSIDVLIRRSTLTLSRDTVEGQRAVAVNFYDGTGIMLPAGLAAKGLEGLAGLPICIAPDTTTETVMRDLLGSRKIPYTPVAAGDFATRLSMLVRGECQAIGDDLTGLIGLRPMLPRPADFAILPQAYSKEPLGPFVRTDDDEWFDLVRWVTMALIEGEELGITSENAERQRRRSQNPAVRRLLGEDEDIGKALGLDARWAYRMLRTVGNYGEIYERNLGAGSSFKLERGLNDLWTRGGLVYAWPFR